MRTMILLQFLLKVSHTMEPSRTFDRAKIERPDPLLFKYYVYVSLLGGPLAPLILLPL